MINNITVEGRVATDPKIKTVSNGNKVMEFGFASNVTKKEEDVNFYIVSLWVQPLFQYVSKGKLMLISGMFRAEKYKTTDGVERITNKIIAQQVDLVCRNKGDEERKEEKIIEEKSKDNKKSPNDFVEDDIPF